MIEFQRGTMQSELAFITSQIAKFIFKDAFLIITFAFPLPTVTQSVQNLFSLTQEANMTITLTLALFLSCFLFMGVSKVSILQQNFKYLIRLFIPWLDIFSLPIITINIQLLTINLDQNAALAVFNLVSVVSISIIQIFYNLFHFTK
jgi:hypothetical protein